MGEIMSMRDRFTAILLAAFAFNACSNAPTPRKLAQDAVAAMGGVEKLQSIKTLSMKGGTGTRTRLGQMVKATDQETPGQLNNVVETVDLTNGRASLDYELQVGGFMQHRHEILTKLGGKPVGIEIVGTRPIIATSPGGLFSWGTQNSPEFILKRNAVTIALAAAESLSDSGTAETKELDGKTYQFGAGKTKDGEDFGAYFDPQSKMLAAFEFTDTETILGDLPAQYLLSDYKTVDGITLPHRIIIHKGSKDYSDVQFATMSVNDPASEQIFAIPESAAAEAEKAAASGEYSPMKIMKVGNGVYQAQGYSHHSMIVEFPQYLALMDAPYTETQTTALFRAIQEQFPGKPVKYVGVSHFHFDHIGGLRGAAAMGATILIEKGHEPILRPFLEARHTHPPDELDKRRNGQGGQPAGGIEVFEGKKVISEGGQSFELHSITGGPHVDPMVLGYASSGRALFQPDLYTPPSTMPAGPAAVHLSQGIKSLNLRVDTMVGGHGGVGKYADFMKAAVAPASSN
jgi:glyoxylase-like metal-dependent hydrolase (beta-lactamase superfamily II)